MNLRILLASAAMLLVAADDTPEPEWVARDPVVPATIAGVPARLRLDPGGLGAPILNPDFAARAGIKGGLFHVAGRVGPVKVPGETAVVRFDLGRGEFKRRIGWFEAPIVEGADGWIGPGTLSAPVVRFALHDPVPGERTVSLPMVNTVHAWLGTTIIVGGEEVQVRFSTMRDRSVATAAAGNAIAAGQGGKFDRPPERMVIYLGVERPVRHVALSTPLAIGPLSLTGLMVRTSDFGNAVIPDADEQADPDEIVVTGRKKQKRERRLEIGRDYLDRCSSIVFDKPRKLLTLSCR